MSVVRGIARGLARGVASGSAGVGGTSSAQRCWKPDGTDDYAANDALAAFLGSDFTFAFSSKAPLSSVVSANSNANFFVLAEAAGIATGNGAGVVRFTNNISEIHDWMVIYDSSKVDFARWRLFVDGVEKTQASTSGVFTAPSTTGPFNLFRRTNGTAYGSGSFWNIGLWTGVKTYEEVQAVDATNLVAYYLCNTTSGTDSSGNGRNLTLNNTQASFFTTVS